MTVQSTFSSTMTATDARDTFNAMLADIIALRNGVPSAITLALSGAQSVAEGGSLTFTVTRGGDVSRAVTVAYQTAGTGTNPVNAADHPGGVFPSGTITIAANATTGTITVASNQDSDVEPNETGLLTISSSTGGVTISPATAQYTFANDDVASGDTIVFGPQTVADTGYVSTGSARHKITGKLADVDPCNLRVASDATGANCLLFEYGGFGGWTMSSVVNGTKNNLIGGNGLALGAQPAFEFLRTDGHLKLTVGGTVIFDANVPAQTGTYARANVSGGQSFTITALA